MSGELVRGKGRPLKFPSVEKLQERVDEYFTDRDTTGRPYTITGLALWLDASSRECLLNYEERDDYFDTISRAKMRCQAYAEEQLYTAKSANGPIFALKNFGWSDLQKVDISGQNDIIIIPPKRLVTDDDDSDE